MADESNPFPFNESSIFPWLKTAAGMWLNMAKTLPPSSDTTLKHKLLCKTVSPSSWKQFKSA